MVRECVSRGVREIGGKAEYTRVLRVHRDGNPRAVDLDTYVSTRVFKTVLWNDV